MSETSTEPSMQELSSKIDHLTLGLKWLCVVALLALSIPNFLVSLTIGQFTRFFHHVLPGKPLPDLTEFIIHHSSLLLNLTFIWPLIGILSVTLGKKSWGWIGAALILGLIAFQIMSTWVGLHMPLISTTDGMSDLPAH